MRKQGYYHISFEVQWVVGGEDQVVVCLGGHPVNRHVYGSICSRTSKKESDLSSLISNMNWMCLFTPFKWSWNGVIR